MTELDMALPKDNNITPFHTIMGELNLTLIELSRHKKSIKIVTCQRNYNNQVGYFRITPECHQEMLKSQAYYLFIVLDKYIFYNARLVKAANIYYSTFINWDLLMTEVNL